MIALTEKKLKKLLKMADYYINHGFKVEIGIHEEKLYYMNIFKSEDADTTNNKKRVKLSE